MSISPFASAIAQICDEKNLPQAVVLEAIEAALAAAYRKDYGSHNQKIRAEFDPNTGFSRVFRRYEVKKKSEINNPDGELTLADARRIKNDVHISDFVEEEVTPKGYGRIAAQTAKQVIIQRIREAEREALYEVYKGREGEMLFGQVQRMESSGAVFIDVGKTTVVLERPQQIPGETFYNGQRVKLYLEKVERTDKGPNIVISRTHPQMIARLLEMEVPEIAEGTVLIKGIAREAGIRTKISVASKEEGIDPVGSCVGQKGVRIQAVTGEIGNEKIDIVEWDPDSVKYLINALSPARIISIKLDENRKLAQVYVTEDQRSLAIGRNGQNVRLASILTGWEIDIEDWVGEPQKEGEADTAKTPTEPANPPMVTEEKSIMAETTESKKMVKEKTKGKKPKAKKKAKTTKVKTAKK